MSVVSGYGKPVDAFGMNGDTYIDNRSCFVYTKEGGIWAIGGLTTDNGIVFYEDVRGNYGRTINTIDDGGTWDMNNNLFYPSLNTTGTLNLTSFVLNGTVDEINRAQFADAYFASNIQMQGANASVDQAVTSQTWDMGTNAQPFDNVYITNNGSTPTNLLTSVTGTLDGVRSDMVNSTGATQTVMRRSNSITATASSISNIVGASTPQIIVSSCGNTTRACFNTTISGTVTNNVINISLPASLNVYFNNGVTSTGYIPGTLAGSAFSFYVYKSSTNNSIIQIGAPNSSVPSSINGVVNIPAGGIF